MKYIKIGDIFLLIILISVILFILNKNKTVNKNIITIDTSYKNYRYRLDENKVIDIKGLKGQSIIEIKDGEVRFLESPCPDKLCVIDGILKNRPLICMVNAVIVRYDSDKNKKNEIDSVGY